MSNQIFRRDELVLEHSTDGRRHSVRIVKVVNRDVSFDDDTAEIMFGAFAVKVPKDSLHKIPASIKKKIKESEV